MARKKVIQLDADKTIAFEKKGQKLQGYYLGYKTVETKFGPSRLQIFQTDAGNVGAWGSKGINDMLERVPAGSLTFVEYKGKVSAGKFTKHLFDVDYDDEESIDVGNISFNVSSEESGEEQGEEAQEADPTEEPEAMDYEQGEEPADTDPEETEESEEVEEQAPPRGPLKRGAPSSVSAEQARKAQALLNKHRKR